MQIWCLKGTLYKGLFTLILALITFEYLFGTFIETRSWANFFPTNATSSNRVQFPEKFNRRHHPLSKTLIGVNNPLDNTTTTKSYNFTNNLFDYNNFTTVLANMTYFDNLEDLSENNKLNATGIPLCPETPPNLHGRISVVKSPVPALRDLEKRFSWLKAGGHFYPETCKTLKKVAIVVPFRCRSEHLLIFLQHMHPLLKKQQIDYTLFVVEQEGNGTFNRAMLMNIGFLEASKLDKFDCFIFHDVDLLPEDDRNLYTCPEQPRHMSVAVDMLKYRLPYPTIFGGVCAITADHFKLLNGFSNSFWGWGGEDDDMSNRIRFHKLHISRYPISIARYTMLRHKKDKPSPRRYAILKAGTKKFDKDGINTTKYALKELKKNLLYTWFLVQLDPPS